MNNNQKPSWWKLFIEDYSTKRPRRGEVREATILSVSDRDMLVELDGKRDGIVFARDLESVNQDYRSQLQVGDKIPVRVAKVPLNRSSIIVSLKQGLEYQDWLRAERLLETQELLEVKVIASNRGGVLVAFGRLRGFVPNSHLSSIPRGLQKKQRQEKKEKLIDQILSVVVLEVNQRRRRLVLSERKAQAQHRKEILEELHEGAIRTGAVRNLVDFGAFVDLGGIDGLIHISELSWDHVNHPRDVLSPGEEVEIYVLDVDRERERISLSRKRLLPDPWVLVADKLQDGDIMEGTITNIASFGAFVDLGEGVEGLIHTSSMPNDMDLESDLEKGASVTVQILEIDPVRKRISLQLQKET